MASSSLLSLALFGPALLLYWALAATNRRLGVAVFCALLPAYLVRFALPLPGTGLALPTTFLELMFAGLFAAWFFTDGLKKKDAWRATSRWALPLALFCLGATLGVFVSPDLRAAVGVWRAYFLEPALFFLLFVDVIRTRRDRLFVLGGLGACLAIIGVTAVFQKVTGYGIPDPWQAAAARRVTAFFGYPNAIGLFAAPVSALMAAWAADLLRRPGPRRLLGLLPAAAAALGLLAALFAVSKGSLVGAAVGLALIGLLAKPLRAATLGLVIAGCLIVSLVGPVTHYFGSLVSLRDDSGSVRAIVWQESWDMLADHPVFGAGLAGYQPTLAPYHQAKYIEVFMYPHDIFLNFWSETGLIGLAGLIWLLIVFFRVAELLRRRLPDDWLPAALIGAMAAVLVHGLVDVPYFKNDLAMLFWTLFGLAESLALQPKAVRPPTVDKKPAA